MKNFSGIRSKMLKTTLKLFNYAVTNLRDFASIECRNFETKLHFVVIKFYEGKETFESNKNHYDLLLNASFVKIGVL